MNSKSSLIQINASAANCAILISNEPFLGSIRPNESILKESWEAIQEHLKHLLRFLIYFAFAALDHWLIKLLLGYF